jgi:SAM-dependent methyltransferase
LVEALQLGHAAVTLHDLNVLAALAEATRAEDLAEKLHLDPVMLRGVLDYVAARTDLVRKDGQRFVATRNYSHESRYLLDLYGLAFRNNATQLAALLRRPSLARSAVDQVRRARALDSAIGDSAGALPGIVRQLGFNHLLDLGCGAGALLVRLAEQDPAFVGWGLEINPAMCRRARRRIREARVGNRVRIVQGDARRLRSSLPNEIRAQVRSACACQLANEQFGAGRSRAVEWFRSLHARLPGRPLLVCDYYGRLGTRTRQVRREVLLHDYVQLISGQGVPPAGLDEWKTIYSEGGCRLVHVIEDPATTLFVHVVVL